MKKILSVIGTRPEGIKLAPVILELEKYQNFSNYVCLSGQHTNLLDSVLSLFGIQANFDLHIMKENQDLFDITSNCLLKLKKILFEVKPDLVLVQGDTSTALSAAMAAFYLKIPIGHVEAGLRTGNLYSPFPEEANRLMISQIASLHFAPTSQAYHNLLKEGKSLNSIFLTGNTSIDALLFASKHKEADPWIKNLFFQKSILLTCHRRENFGEPLNQIFSAVQEFSLNNPNISIIYPVHPNPNVFHLAHKMLGNNKNIHLTQPLEYHNLIYAMQHSSFILTDSGGIQEEAPTFGKPILVLRDITERQEGVLAGCAKLTGWKKDDVLKDMNLLLDENHKVYKTMSSVQNPYGDGKAAQKIVLTIMDFFFKSGIKTC